MFTQRKFTSLPLARQHKNAAELLREVYTGGNALLLEHYRELARWMDLAPLEQAGRENISNRYHWHMRQAGMSFKEQSLLPDVRVGDRETPLAPPLPVSIYLDHLRSAHNVGSIIRTVEAFSLGTVLLSPDTPDLSHNQVKKAAMGADEWVDVQGCKGIDDVVGPVVALETSADAIPLWDYNFPERFTLALGNEELGCSEAVLERADVVVEIPLVGRKNSLNVANAFAIVAGEVRRQLLSKV